MFASGSSKANDQLIQLIGLVTQVVTQMPNQISISGHTDSRPFRSDNGYSNWELSSDRANAARRLLIDAGLGEGRVANVQGRSATEPLLSEDTTDASNRRISIVLLRENLAVAPIPGGATDAPVFKDEREVQPASAPRHSDPLKDARTLNLTPRG